MMSFEEFQALVMMCRIGMEKSNAKMGEALAEKDWAMVADHAAWLGSAASALHALKEMEVS